MKLDLYDKQDRFRFSIHLPISELVSEKKIKRAVKLLLKKTGVRIKTVKTKSITIKL